MSTYTGACSCGDFSFHTGRRREAIKMKRLHESINASIQRDTDEDWHRVAINARVERAVDQESLGVFA